MDPLQQGTSSSSPTSDDTASSIQEKSGAIWEKLAEERERRRLLRSKFANKDAERLLVEPVPPPASPAVSPAVSPRPSTSDIVAQEQERRRKIRSKFAKTAPEEAPHDEQKEDNESDSNSIPSIILTSTPTESPSESPSDGQDKTSVDEIERISESATTEAVAALAMATNLLDFPPKQSTGVDVAAVIAIGHTPDNICQQVTTTNSQMSSDNEPASNKEDADLALFSLRDTETPDADIPQFVPSINFTSMHDGSFVAAEATASFMPDLSTTVDTTMNTALLENPEPESASGYRGLPSYMDEIANRNHLRIIQAHDEIDEEEELMLSMKNQRKKDRRRRRLIFFIWLMCCCFIIAIIVPVLLLIFRSADSSSASSNSRDNATNADRAIDFTSFPTLPPTPAPSSRSATDFPTAQLQTEQPTTNPTTSPIMRPTMIPTANPTMSPTINPTVNPTKSPSTRPSVSPTTGPTISPTSNPTSGPSLSPSSQPTQSIQDTLMPSDGDTAIPVWGPFDVVIVGAGIAGLAAARELMEVYGIDKILILEATSQVGGRCQTRYDIINNAAGGDADNLRRRRRKLDDDDSTGIAVELGSSWITPNTDLAYLWQNLTTSDSSKSYVETKYDYESLGLYHVLSTNSDDGEMGPFKTKLQRDMLWWYWNGKDGFLGFLQDYEEYYGTIDSSTTYAQMLERYEELYLSSRDDEGRAFVRSMLNAEIANKFGASIGEVPVLSTLDLLGPSEDDPLWFIDGRPPPSSSSSTTRTANPDNNPVGYDRLMRYLAEPAVTMDTIRYDAVVTTIDYQQNSADGTSYVELVYKDKNNQDLPQFVLASKVLITVSLGVLQDTSAIQFTPSLPAEKARAIESIGYATANKCFLYWNQSDIILDTWWPTSSKLWLNTVQSDLNGSPAPWSSFFNARAAWMQDNAQGAPAILIGFVGGDDAEAVEDESDEQMLEGIMQSLRQAFSDGDDLADIPMPSSFHVTRWGKEEFARGANSFPKDESDSLFRKALKEPVNNALFWAGEATEETMYATTAGAYKSGVEAAAHITSS